MTEEQFFNTHQIAYRGEVEIHEFMVLNLKNGNIIKKYNFDHSNIDTIQFEFFRGNSFNDQIIEMVSNEIKTDFNID